MLDRISEQLAGGLLKPQEKLLISGAVKSVVKDMGDYTNRKIAEAATKAGVK